MIEKQADGTFMIPAGKKFIGKSFLVLAALLKAELCEKYAKFNL